MPSRGSLGTRREEAPQAELNPLFGNLLNGFGGNIQVHHAGFGIGPGMTVYRFVCFGLFDVDVREGMVKVDRMEGVSLRCLLDCFCCLRFCRLISCDCLV